MAYRCGTPGCPDLIGEGSGRICHDCRSDPRVRVLRRARRDAVANIRALRRLLEVNTRPEDWTTEVQEAMAESAAWLKTNDPERGAP